MSKERKKRREARQRAEREADIAALRERTAAWQGTQREQRDYMRHIFYGTEPRPVQADLQQQAGAPLGDWRLAEDDVVTYVNYPTFTNFGTFQTFTTAAVDWRAVVGMPEPPRVPEEVVEEQVEQTQRAQTVWEALENAGRALTDEETR